MKRVIVAVVAALMFGGAATAAQAASVPAVAIELFGGPFEVQPTALTLSGDGAFFIAGVGPRYGQITWNYWNPTSASGTGVAWADDCRPDCADGTHHGFRVHLWLWRPALLNGRAAFTRMKIVYLHNVPVHGRRVTFWYYRDGWR